MSGYQVTGVRSEYERALGENLRAARARLGLSLRAVEVKSNGRWKAVVVGSYERGARSVTVARLAELAEFYGVQVTGLLPGAEEKPDAGVTLRKAAALARDKTPALAVLLDLMAGCEREEGGDHHEQKTAALEAAREILNGGRPDA